MDKYPSFPDSSIRRAGLIRCGFALAFLFFNMPDLRMHELIDSAERTAHGDFRIESAVINPTLALHPKRQTIQTEQDYRNRGEATGNDQANGRID
jgi:hypothetical protein